MAQCWHCWSWLRCRYVYCRVTCQLLLYRCSLLIRQFIGYIATNTWSACHYSASAAIVCWLSYVNEHIRLIPFKTLRLLLVLRYGEDIEQQMLLPYTIGHGGRAGRHDERY